MDAIILPQIIAYLIVDKTDYQLTLSLVLTNLFGVRLCMILIFIARYCVIIITDVLC